MYMNPEVLKARALNADNLVIKHRKFSSNTKPKLTHDEQVMLGTLAKIDGAREVERHFNVSQTAISNFARGVSAISSGVNKELLDDVEAKVKGKNEEISDKALGTLANALGLVDERIKDKGNKATDLAKIARDMSIIHKNMAPPQQLQGVNLGMQIIIQAPQQKQINDYEIMVSE